MGKASIPNDSDLSLLRQMYREFREGYDIKRQRRILGKRGIWGHHDTDRDRIVVRSGLRPDEEERTLLHEGLHAINYSDDENSVEQKAQAIHQGMSPGRRRRLRSFLP